MADHDKNHVRLFLWIVPRTISTALTKCLTSAIDGMEVWFECFTYCSLVGRQYKLATGEDMPMEYEGNEEKARKAAEIYNTMRAGSKIEADRIVYGNVKKRMEASTSKYLLAKEGCFAFVEERSWQYLPKGFKHVFLIRDPYRVFTSYKKAIYDHVINLGIRTGDNEKAFDLEKDDPFENPNEFYRGIHAAWMYIRANVDPKPIVINSDDLLANPADMLSKFCHKTGLPYSDSLLQWDASPDVTRTWKVPSDDILWEAAAFYETAACSSKFLPPKAAVSPEMLPPDVRKTAEASMPYFQEMDKFKL